MILTAVNAYTYSVTACECNKINHDNSHIQRKLIKSYSKTDLKKNKLKKTKLKKKQWCKNTTYEPMQRTSWKGLPRLIGTKNIKRTWFRNVLFSWWVPFQMMFIWSCCRCCCFACVVLVFFCAPNMLNPLERSNLIRLLKAWIQF